MGEGGERLGPESRGWTLHTEGDTGSTQGTARERQHPKPRFQKGEQHTTFPSQTLYQPFSRPRDARPLSQAKETGAKTLPGQGTQAG